MNQPQGNSWGQYRKKVYAVLQRILGRDLRESEHDEIKKTLVEYVQAFVKASSIRTEHLYVCRKCRGQVKIASPMGRKRIRRDKEAEHEVVKTTSFLPDVNDLE